MALLRLCTLFILLELQHCLPTGHNGLPGRDGKDGVAGKDGREGVPGRNGREGVAGKDGREGLPGRNGREGVAGKDGKDGVAGKKGEKGDRGMMGAQGPPGEFGPAGPSGPKGEKGERGPAGPLPPIILVELQSELQSLKDFVNKITQFHFTRVGRKYFVTNKKTGSFDEAVKLCRSVGGVPALPTSLKENQALLGLVSATGSTYAWLSANDRKTEGRFVDLQGKAIRYSKWERGQPDNGGGAHDCVVMHSPSGIWSDYLCEHAFLIVCEI